MKAEESKVLRVKTNKLVRKGYRDRLICDCGVVMTEEEEGVWFCWLCKKKIMSNIPQEIKENSND